MQLTFEQRILSPIYYSNCLLDVHAHSTGIQPQGHKAGLTNSTAVGGIIFHGGELRRSSQENWGNKDAMHESELPDYLSALSPLLYFPGSEHSLSLKDVGCTRWGPAPVYPSSQDITLSIVGS